MYVDLGLENGGFPINVSEGGMAFQGIRSLEKNQLIQINFKLPGSGAPVESSARIAWLNDLGKGGGLRFIDLPEAARRLINDWLSLQTSSSGGTKDTAMLPTKAESKNFLSAPRSLETDQNHSSAKAHSSAVKALLVSPLSPVTTTNVIAPSGSMAIPIQSVNSARDFGFPGPYSEAGKRNAWSTPFSLRVITSLAAAAIFGAILFQLDGGLQFPTWIGNSAQPVSESVAATAPPNSSETQPADAPPGDTTASLPAPLFTRPAVDTKGPSDQPAASALKAPVSHPAKLATPMKVSPPKTSSHQMAMSMKHVIPNVKVKSPAADVAPPAVMLPTNPGLAPQLPALLSETRPPVPSPREPVQRSSKFDPAQIITRTNAVYPKVAQAVGLSGSVELQFIVGEDGSVRNATVVKGNPLLARAAVDAIYAWRFQPARRDGIPVKSESSAVFVFKPN
jgi:TonB family protein